MNLRMTDQETRQIYKEILEEKKTLRSKKIFMGKSLRHSEELLKNYREAFARPFGQRWYAGEHITATDIRREEREIAIIKEITATL